MTRLPTRFTPDEFAAAYQRLILDPALEEVSGRDGRLSSNEASNAEDLGGIPALAAPKLTGYFDHTGFRTSKVTRVRGSQVDAARAAAEDAIGADGRVADDSAFPEAWQGVLLALRAADPVPQIPRSRARSLDRVAQAYDLDPDELLAHAQAFNADGNGHLKRSELEAAAKDMTGALEELGIISDLDKTIIPPHRDVLPENAYPGIVQLLTELDLRSDGASPDDITYVTARSPDRVEEVPDWLEDRDLPGGPIETGVSPVPWIAEREKISDVSRVMDASPGQRFVLFGDSSHRDPEVYRAIIERYPDRIVAAFIHRVTNFDDARTEGLHAIDDYASAAAILLRQGTLSEDAARRVMVAAQVQGLEITDAEIEALLLTGRT